MGRLALEDRNDAETQETACTWFRKAAHQGHARAHYELGYFYCDGMTLLGEKDYRKAILWLTKAAEQGEPDAWLRLGHCYGEGGHGIAQDLSRARECYQKADEKGNPTIWCAVGMVYQLGGHGLAADWPKAFACYKRAAGLKNSEAQYHLGRQRRDLASAVDLFGKTVRVPFVFF